MKQYKRNSENELTRNLVDESDFGKSDYEIKEIRNRKQIKRLKFPEQLLRLYEEEIREPIKELNPLKFIENLIQNQNREYAIILRPRMEVPFEFEELLLKEVQEDISWEMYRSKYGHSGVEKLEIEDYNQWLFEKEMFGERQNLPRNKRI